MYQSSMKNMFGLGFYNTYRNRLHYMAIVWYIICFLRILSYCHIGIHSNRCRISSRGGESRNLISSQSNNTTI